MNLHTLSELIISSIINYHALNLVIHIVGMSCDRMNFDNYRMAITPMFFLLNHILRVWLVISSLYDINCD